MAKKQAVVLNEKQTQIWDDIKDREAQYYSIKNQTVSTISEPMNIDQESLYLTLKGPAALLSIEEVLGTLMIKSWSGKNIPKYIVEQRDQYACIMDNPEAKPPVKK